LVKPVWHSSTPGRIAQAEEWGTASEGWKALSAHLARRPVSQSVAALLPGKSISLAWGMPVAEPVTSGSRVPTTSELCAALDRLEHGKSWKLGTNAVEVAIAWMTETARRHGTTAGLNGNAFGLECIAFARALPALSGLLPGDQWWQLVDRLFLVVDEASHGNELSVLERQWLAAELPLVLAYVLPELKPARELARRGGQELATALRTAVAADGMPSARQWDEVPALLATWARSRILAQSLKKSGWNQESQDRYANFARQVLRLSRRDGGLALSKTEGSRAGRDLLAAAFVSADRADRILATSLIGGQELPRNVSAKSLPPPAVNNEAAGVTVLRPNWSRNSERVTVTRAGSEVRIELACGRDVLWSGVWTCEVRRNGELLVPEADAEWDEVCWTSTEDADYLELEIALPENIRVQRQIVLAREDGFLFLADAVLGTEAASLEYRGALPLGAEVSFDPSTETREGYLVGRKPRGLAFPLALPEWKAQPSAGALEGTLEQTLELRAARRDARCLYAPLFIDLNSRRIFRPATWRQLTVAEDRQTLSPDVAVGYRVQVRDEQWLLYRSLGKRGNRTLLGHNLVSEFLVARFKTDGDIEPLVEIE
jgi:hypothetical protein